MKQVLETWEPAEFRELLENSVPLCFVGEEPQLDETLKEANAKIIEAVDAFVADWPIPPSYAMRQALRVVALYVTSKIVWNATDDILATRIIDLVCDAEFHAHSDGVVVESTSRSCVLS